MCGVVNLNDTRLVPFNKHLKKVVFRSHRGHQINILIILIRLLKWIGIETWNIINSSI